VDEIIGLNAIANIDEQYDLDLENIDKYKFCEGKEKVFPYGPTVTFNRKKVPCYVTSTESGSITTEELTLMLKYMDELCLIDRSEEIDPMIILDGHISTMMGQFLEYVNNPQHRWSAMLCIPYGTHLWHAGDAVEKKWSLQNSNVKVEMMDETTEGRFWFAANYRENRHHVVTYLGMGWELCHCREQKERMRRPELEPLELCSDGA
jgi:hypothetical protein